MMATDTLFTIELDGTTLRSADDFYLQLSAATLIDHQNNLDALVDDLQSEIPLCCGPYRIIWKNAERSDWSGHSGLTKVLGVLAFNQQFRSERFVGLELCFEPEPGEDTWSYPAAYNSPHYVAERQRRLDRGLVR